MMFQIGPSNRPTRMVATLVLLSFGVGMVVCMPTPIGFAGIGLTAIGGCLLCSLIWSMAREGRRRRDRYDLTLLDDTRGYTGPSRDHPGSLPGEPEWDAQAEDAAYCHRCDTSVPNHCAICPGCGAHLGC